MDFPVAKEDESLPSPLFYHRFNRKFDQRMKQLLMDHSFLAQAKDPEKPAAISRRSKLNVSKGTISAYSHAFPKNKKILAKRKLLQNDMSAAKPPENDTSLSSLSQMASDLRTMFAKMPRPPKPDVSKLTQETRRTPEKHPSPKLVPLAYNAFPRVSASSTPRRQPVPPSDTARSKSQHRPKASSRRGKDPIDMSNFQQFFAQFHLKSRQLLQQLEANVLGK